MGYRVIRDTREQLGWDFSVSSACEEQIEQTLPTGDYTLVGYEKLFVIERKGTSGEFARNIVQDRFDREMKRLEAFPHAFIVCEFDMLDIQNFPQNSGIPQKHWPKLRVTPQFFLMRFWELQLKYHTRIVLAGQLGGRNAASSLFKRIIENVQAEAA